MRDKIIIWTPDIPDGYGVLDQWEEDYCEFCHKPYEECICNTNTDDDENI